MTSIQERRRNLKHPKTQMKEMLDQVESNDDRATQLQLTGWTHIDPNALALSLQSNRNIVHLSLSACNLGDEGIERLSPSLRYPPIQYINLSGNGIKCAGLVHLSQGLLHHKTMQEVVLSWNAFADDGVVALSKTLLTTSIHALDLSGTLEGRGGGRKTSIREKLARGIFNVGDEGCIALASSMPLSRLSRLNLSRQDRITGKGVTELARALEQSSCSLEELSLQRLPIDDNGAVALGLALPHCRLKILEMDINEISDRGALAITRGLASNTTLEVVTMTQSCIGVQGLQALEQAAASNIYLRRLELYGHLAGPEGRTYVYKIKPWLRLNRITWKVIERGREELFAHLLANACRKSLSRLFCLLREMVVVFVYSSKNAVCS